MGISGLHLLYDEVHQHQETGSEVTVMPAKNTSTAPCSETLDDIDDIVDADVKDADFNAEETQA